MTLLIAAKAGPALNPNGHNFTFEPGIVIAADTRLTCSNGTHVDNGLKVGVVGPHGICGMSSSSIDIPTQAFYYFDGFMQSHPDASTNEAIKELQRLLKDAHNDITSKRNIPKPRTTVFFGHCDPSTNEQSLYRLDSNDDFLPILRDGFNAAGSHTSWVQESFERIKCEYPTLTLHPFDGFPNNTVTFREGVVALVITLIDAALDVARQSETATGREEAIGGSVHAVIITADGPKAFDTQSYDNLKAWQIFENRLG